MKYLKKYESTEQVISIDLFGFCDFFGMFKSIQKLIDLKDNSDAIGFIISETQNEHYYKKSDNIEMREKIVQDEFYINKGDDFALRIGNYVFSYGYLKASNDQNVKGVTINFYNVNIEDENILFYIRTKKFNI